MTDIGLVGVEELEVARARAREVERARGRAEQIEIIATHGPWLVGSEDRLFRQTGALDPTDFFALDDVGGVAWLERPRDPHPRTLSGLKAQERKQAEQAQQNAERQRSELMAKPLRPVQLQDVRDGGSPTVREAGRTITESHGGELRERDGRLDPGPPEAGALPRRRPRCLLPGGGGRVAACRAQGFSTACAASGSFPTGRSARPGCWCDRRHRPGRALGRGDRRPGRMLRPRRLRAAGPPSPTAARAALASRPGGDRGRDPLVGRSHRPLCRLSASPRQPRRARAQHDPRRGARLVGQLRAARVGATA
jgi:hypothetical protein